MFFKTVISAIAVTVALNATAAFADNLTREGAKSGGIAVTQKAPRSNGLKVRFADYFQKAPATKASKGVHFDSSKNKVFKIEKSGNSRPVSAGKPKARVVKQGMSSSQARALNTQKKATSPKYQAYKQNQHKLATKSSGGLKVKNGKVVPPKNARFGTTAHVRGKGSSATAKGVHFDSSRNKVVKIEKSGKSRPVSAGKPKARVVKQGMSSSQARALNAQKKATSPKYQAYKQNQRKLAKKSSGGLKVKNGKVVPPKNARLGTTAHLKNTGKGVKNTRKTAKAARTLKKGAKIAKTGRKLRTVGKIATGGAASMAVGAALGVKVPDAVDAAMFAGKLVTDPKNAHKRLYGAAKGGVKMIGTAATTITDPSRMARNLGNAAKGVGRSVANTKVYKTLAKTKTGRAIGKVTSWTTKKAGAGYTKFKKTKTAKAIGKAAKAVDKQVFKRANKGVKTIGKGATKASRKIAKGAKKTAGKFKKGAKKVAKKLKFW